jgi:hypothetical protein
MQRALTQREAQLESAEAAVANLQVAIEQVREPCARVCCVHVDVRNVADQCERERSRERTD